MKERPILFSTAMVRAILDGRKTQTRRVIKSAMDGRKITGLNRHSEPGFRDTFASNKGDDFWAGCCPYGVPGDTLWVRETFGIVTHAFDENENMIDWVPDRPSKSVHEMKLGRGYWNGHVIYMADGAFEWNAGDDPTINICTLWNPAIHMPRSACRLLLPVLEVRAERLQDITEEDAIAEGIERVSSVGPMRAFGWRDYGGGRGFIHPVESFRSLWDSINAKRGFGWNANPWVWGVTFAKQGGLAL